MSADELFPIVTPEGKVTGSATRHECHSGTMLLHPVVHLHVVALDGSDIYIYLQQRALTKDIQPGRWDTSVGGHIDFGETVAQALRREAGEELHLSDFTPRQLKPYVFRSDREQELINPFVTIVERSVKITPDPAEISDGRFWSLKEIEENLHLNIFTPNFEYEFINHLKPYLLEFLLDT